MYEVTNTDGKATVIHLLGRALKPYHAGKEAEYNNGFDLFTMTRVNPGESWSTFKQK